MAFLSREMLPLCAQLSQKAIDMAHVSSSYRLMPILKYQPLSIRSGNIRSSAVAHQKSCIEFPSTYKPSQATRFLHSYLRDSKRAEPIHTSRHYRTWSYHLGIGYFRRSSYLHLRLFSTNPTDKEDSEKKSLHEPNILPIPIQTHRDKPPPISKVLSILLPEYKWLTLAVGALTISTAATMQFPNAIGSMIDILNGLDIAAGKESLDTTYLIGDVQSIDKMLVQKEEMKSIAAEMMGYFTVGAIGTAVHSAMFDSIGQVS